MGYWLKSFNADPAPLPGTTYTVAQINNREFNFRLYILINSANYIYKYLSPLPVFSSSWHWPGVGCLMGHVVALAGHPFTSAPLRL
jgi:ACS family pantothenate transporter-like MFS transporter